VHDDRRVAVSPLAIDLRSLFVLRYQRIDAGPEHQPFQQSDRARIRRELAAVELERIVDETFAAQPRDGKGNQSRRRSARHNYIGVGSQETEKCVKVKREPHHAKIEPGDMWPYLMPKPIPG
jgi:hypothetical protein